MSTEENKALVERWFQALNDRTAMQHLSEFYAPTYVLHDPAAPPDLPPGPEAIQQMFGAYATAFPEAKATIDELITAGDRVVIRFTMRTTHQGEFEGLQPTGKPITITGISIVRFADGKMVEEWQQMDNLGMMQQLGAIPTRGQTTREASA
jgi:steroid delta-isomerase-like uncharacterized protein